MPKPKRLDIPFELVKEIWDELINKVPWVKEKQNKSEYFADLAQKCNVKATSIQQYLYEPLNKVPIPQSIPLSMEAVHTYCDFTGSTELKRRITEACNTKNTEFEGNILKSDIQNKIWYKEIPKYFLGTVWYSYERHERGLSRSVIVIHDKNESGFCMVELRIHEKNHESYYGIVAFDNSRNYLIINFVTKETNQKYLHLLMRVGNGTKPLICIGHDSYISTHHQKILTKSVIWEKVDNPNEAEPRFLRYDSDDYQNLHWTIKRYLKEIRINRLTSPRRAITNLTEFEIWFQDRDLLHPTDELLKSYCSGYYLYYCYQHSNKEWKIREDELDISIDDTGKIKAEFLHKLDEWSQYEVWQGEVYRNQGFLSFFFSKSVYHDINTIFMMVSIPSNLSKETFECFVGVINGLRDTGRNMVSYQMILVRKDISDFQGKTDERLVSFFMKEGREKRISPPSLEDYTLNELNEI